MSRLLILEDDEQMGARCEKEFREEGYEVTWVRTAGEALGRIDRNRPDVLVLELRLPDGHGLDVMRHGLEIRPEMAVVIHSAYPGYRADFSSWSAESFVVKSGNLDRLKIAVEDACGIGLQAA